MSFAGDLEDAFSCGRRSLNDDTVNSRIVFLVLGLRQGSVYS